MRYLLITPKGRVIEFYIKSLAETYQQAYGGCLITDQMYAEVYGELLVDSATEPCYNT